MGPLRRPNFGAAIGSMLGTLVFDVILGAPMAFRSRRRFDAAPPLSTRSVQRAIGAGPLYAAWAARRAFSAVENGFVGNVLGHEVNVHPGLEGSAPRGVEAEIALAHGFDKPVLLKPKSGGDLEILFEEIPQLRSIGIFAGGVRLRLDALVEPDVVDAAIDRTISLFEERLRAQARPDPYR